MFFGILFTCFKDIIQLFLGYYSPKFGILFSYFGILFSCFGILFSCFSKNNNRKLSWDIIQYISTD